MNTYELMIKTNEYLISGDTLSDRQKQSIAEQFLSAVSSKTSANHFYDSIGYPNNTDSAGRRMYPEFYVPSYNYGKKYRTLMTQAPKTHILSANSYELEIMRLLYLFAPDNDTVKNMVSRTLARLKTTCFGNTDDGIGECYETSLIVLRFLAAAASGEVKWMKDRMMNYHKHYNERHRHWGVQWYYWLCLSELPLDMAEPEIRSYKDEMVIQLSRSYVMGSDQDKAIHPMMICIVRNCLARLPEFEYIKSHVPFVSEKDGRLHFDMAS